MKVVPGFIFALAIAFSVSADEVRVPLCDYEFIEQGPVEVIEIPDEDQGSETCASRITVMGLNPVLSYAVRSFPLVDPGLAQQLVSVNAWEFLEDKSRWPFMNVYTQGLRDDARLIMEAAVVRDYSADGGSLFIEVTWHNGSRQKHSGFSTRKAVQIQGLPEGAEVFDFFVEWSASQNGAKMAAVATPFTPGAKVLTFDNTQTVPTVAPFLYHVGLVGPGPNLFEEPNEMIVTTITPIDPE